MTSTIGLEPVPWTFVDHELLKVWTWLTPHFEARVTAEQNSFSWEVNDYISGVDGEPRFLTEGRSREFAEAETAVREVIGKSYPPKHGYGSYAGALATTFTIATGERVDFGLFSGSRAVVTVRLPHGIQSFLGHVMVVHYEVIVTPEHGAPVKIQPAHIVKVVGEGGSSATEASAAYTGVGRIYRGSVRRGCSGTPGFLPDTIDHHGPACPVHEDAATRFA